MTRPSTLLGKPFSQAQADCYEKYCRHLREKNAEALRLWRGEVYVRKQIGKVPVIVGD